MMRNREGKLKHFPLKMRKNFRIRSWSRTKPPASSLLQSFQICTCNGYYFGDYWCFFAAVHGVALPMFTLVMGGLVNIFRDFFNNEVSGSGLSYIIMLE